MHDSSIYAYDAAAVMTQGRRDRQEDALVAHFPEGATGLGYIVLADGMGGHAAGHVASAAAVQEIHRGLLIHADDPERLEQDAGYILHSALYRANRKLARLVDAQPELLGMGTTVLVPLIIANRLYWISVGDSPLYLLREGRLIRLNQVHSLHQRMSALVADGSLTQAEVDQHPERDCLTSVVLGREIPEIDCQKDPIDLQGGDIVIAASDGLQFLSDTCIAEIVEAHRNLNSSGIGDALLKAIAALDDPDQDNVAICVLKIEERLAKPAAIAAVAHPDHVRLHRVTLRSYVQINGWRHGERVNCRISSVRGGS